MPLIFIPDALIVTAVPTLTEAKVETPETIRSSKSVRPSTSKLPLASILLENVAVSDTFRTSKSV